MANITFATAINCMDGRAQLPVKQYMIDTYGVDYVDVITEAGPNKILAEKQPEPLLMAIKNRYDISVKLHGSQAVCVVGHFNCGGNPSIEVEQLVQVEKACNVVKSWNLAISVVGLWVDSSWEVSVVWKDTDGRC